MEKMKRTVNREHNKSLGRSVFLPSQQPSLPQKCTPFCRLHPYAHQPRLCSTYTPITRLFLPIFTSTSSSIYLPLPLLSLSLSFTSSTLFPHLPSSICHFHLSPHLHSSLLLLFPSISSGCISPGYHLHLHLYLQLLSATFTLRRFFLGILTASKFCYLVRQTSMFSKMCYVNS